MRKALNLGPEAHQCINSCRKQSKGREHTSFHRFRGDRTQRYHNEVNDFGEIFASNSREASSTAARTTWACLENEIKHTEGMLEPGFMNTVPRLFLRGLVTTQCNNAYALGKVEVVKRYSAASEVSKFIIACGVQLALLFHSPRQDRLGNPHLCHSTLPMVPRGIESILKRLLNSQVKIQSIRTLINLPKGR